MLTVSLDASAQCTHSLIVSNSAGYDWNSDGYNTYQTGQIEVFVNGASVAISTAPNGTSSIDFSVNVGDQVTTSVTPRILEFGGNLYYGLANGNISYDINDGAGAAAASAPAGGGTGSAPANINYTVTAAMCPSCAAPSGLTATAISSSEVELNLTAGSSDSAYFVSYSDGTTTDTLLPAPTSLPFTVFWIISEHSLHIQRWVILYWWSSKWYFFGECNNTL